MKREKNRITCKQRRKRRGNDGKVVKELSKKTKYCKQNSMFSVSACNGSNYGSGIWWRKQNCTGGTGGAESDDSLYDAVKLGLENASVILSTDFNL